MLIMDKSKLYVTNNYAFIDSQNVNLAIKDLGWSLDFSRFRIYLKDKYHVTQAYLFLGWLAENQKLYTFLEKAGYKLIFKPTFRGTDGKVKGNCDAELVLHTMIVSSLVKSYLSVFSTVSQSRTGQVGLFPTMTLLPNSSCANF